jgi:hypothetical protein
VTSQKQKQKIVPNASVIAARQAHHQEPWETNLQAPWETNLPAHYTFDT